MTSNKVYFEKITLTPEEERKYANAYIAVANILVSRNETPSHEQIRDYTAAFLEFGFIPENQEQLENYLLELQKREPEKFYKFTETAFKIDKASYKLVGGKGEKEDVPEKFEISLVEETPKKKIPKWLAYLGIGAILTPTLFTAGAIIYAKTGKHDKEINKLRENVEKIPVIGQIATSYFQLIGLGDKDNDDILDINDKWPELHNFPAQKYAKEKGLSEELIKKYISNFDKDLNGETFDIPKEGKPILTWYAKKIIDLLASLPKEEQEKFAKKYLYDMPHNPEIHFRDIDDDGLSDLVEIKLGLDPFNKDTDGDGIWDFNELIVYPHYLDPKNPNDVKEFLKKIPNVYAQDPRKVKKELSKKLNCGVDIGDINKYIEIWKNDPVIRYYADKVEIKKVENEYILKQNNFSEMYILLVDRKKLMPYFKKLYNSFEEYVKEREKHKHVNWPSYYLTTAKRMGVCSDFSLVAAILLHLNGYPVKIMYIPEHAWVEIKMNGKIYIVDARIWGDIVPIEEYNYYKNNQARCIWKNHKVDW